MTAVDAVQRPGSHLDATPCDQASGFARSVPARVAGEEPHPEIPTIAHRRARIDAYEHAFSVVFARLFSPDGAVSPVRRTTWPAERVGQEGGEDAEGMYLLAATLIGGQRMAEAVPVLHRLDEVTGGWPDWSQWTRRVEFLRAAHAERTADPALVLHHCRQAGAAPGSSQMSSPSVRVGRHQGGFLQSVDAVIADQLPLLEARAHIWLGENRLAQDLLEGRFGGQDGAEASQPATLALLACGQGRLSDALRLATAALETTETPGRTTELVELDARLVLAQVYKERNELESAQEQLEKASRRCWTVGAKQWMWVVEADLIEVMVAQQRADEARQRLHALRYTIGADLTSGLVRNRIDQADVDVRMALGDLDGALELARSASTPGLPGEMLARLDLALGRPDRALTRLSSAHPTNPASEIRQLVLRAGADRQEGRQQRAELGLRRAVEAGRPDHYVRPFLEVPTLTVPLLGALYRSHPEPYLALLLSQAEELVPTTSGSGSPGILEPLTERERQVLRCLSSHHSLPQIAALLGVATNTIKTHVKAIYRKMGATCRNEAVLIGRSHGLF